MQKVAGLLREQQRQSHVEATTDFNHQDSLERNEPSRCRCNKCIKLHEPS